MESKSFCALFAEAYERRLAERKALLQRLEKRYQRPPSDGLDCDEWLLNAQIAGEDLSDDWRYDEDYYGQDVWDDGVDYGDPDDCEDDDDEGGWGDD